MVFLRPKLENAQHDDCGQWKEHAGWTKCLSQSYTSQSERQATPDSRPYSEDFDIRWRPGMNVISALMDIAANPVTHSGKATAPIVYESNCLEEVCGSCAMLINGKPGWACRHLLRTPGEMVRLEPLSRFPVVRDLVVDRSVLFENLKRVKAGPG